MKSVRCALLAKFGFRGCRTVEGESEQGRVPIFHVSLAKTRALPAQLMCELRLLSDGGRVDVLLALLNLAVHLICLRVSPYFVRTRCLAPDVNPYL